MTYKSQKYQLNNMEGKNEIDIFLQFTDISYTSIKKKAIPIMVPGTFFLRLFDS